MTVSPVRRRDGDVGGVVMVPTSARPEMSGREGRPKLKSLGGG